MRGPLPCPGYAPAIETQPVVTLRIAFLSCPCPCPLYPMAGAVVAGLQMGVRYHMTPLKMIAIWPSLTPFRVAP